MTAGSDGWGSASALVPDRRRLGAPGPVPRRREGREGAARAAGGVHRPLRNINIIVLLFSAALFPMWYVGSLYLQQVLALTPLETGLVFLPMALTIFACASQAGKLALRAGVRPVLGGGLIMMTAGMLLFTRIGASGSAVQYVILPGVLTAMGIGFSIVPSTIAATQTAQAGTGRAGLRAGQHLAAGRRRTGPGRAHLDRHALHQPPDRRQHSVDQALTDGFRVAYLIGAGLCAAAAILTFALVPRLQADGARPPPGRRVLGAVAGVVACFAVVGLAVPRTHAAPLGAYTTNGAYSVRVGPGPAPAQADARERRTRGAAPAGVSHARQLLRRHAPADGRPERAADARQQAVAGVVCAGPDQPRGLQPRGPDLRRPAGVDAGGRATSAPPARSTRARTSSSMTITAAWPRSRAPTAGS